MRLGGLSTGAATKQFDDGSYAIARVAGAINVVNIVADGAVSVVESQTSESVGVMDFVSGVITDAQIKDVPLAGGGSAKYLAEFYPTKRTVTTHPDLSADTKQGIERLAVKPFPELGYPDSNESGTIQYSQYTHIHPTMFSGRMRKLVQALSGFGRLSPKDPEPERVGAGNVNISRYPSIYAQVLQEIYRSSVEEQAPIDEPDPETSFQKSLASSGLQIRFDHRFNRTHGLQKADDGAYWLIEVSSANGVLARRLPLHPATVKDEDGEWPFRDELERLEIQVPGELTTREVRDEDGLYILDEFGGFPTGEGFPPSQYLQAYIDAGVVVQLLEAEQLEPFYEHQPYTSVQGWAFNAKGTEAHNTGYRFDPDGIQTGAHYQINIQAPAESTRDPVEGAEAIAKRAKRFAKPDLAEAMYEKALRLSRIQVRQLEDVADRDEFIGLLTGFEVSVPSGSASLILVKEGRLFTKSPKNIQPQQFKSYEPLLGVNVSHDFRPANSTIQQNSNPDCDTPMWVFFDEDELKWVRFFRDSRSRSDTIETIDDDPCKLIGTFETTRITGNRSVSEAFYSNDFDDRRRLADSTYRHVLVSAYMGPSSISVADDPSDFRRNFMRRTHRFRQTVSQETITGDSVATAVATVASVREAYYMGVLERSETRTFTESTHYEHRGDPYAYEGWRCIISTAGFAITPADWRDCDYCDPRMNYPGSTIPPGKRRVRYEGYNPTQCSDAYDQGPWAQKCNDMDAMKYSIPEPPVPPPVNEVENGVGQYAIRLVAAHAPRNVTTFEREITDQWSVEKIFLLNPDEFGLHYHIVRGSFNSLGDTESSLFDRNMNAGDADDGDPIRLVYGPIDFIDMDPGGSIYIGVI